jgi:hypothetical protein
MHWACSKDYGYLILVIPASSHNDSLGHESVLQFPFIASSKDTLSLLQERVMSF